MIKYPMGESQKLVLEGLQQHGEWKETGDWYFRSRSGTKTIMDKLVNHGVAIKKSKYGQDIYYPAPDSSGTEKD